MSCTPFLIPKHSGLFLPDNDLGTVLFHFSSKHRLLLDTFYNASILISLDDKNISLVIDNIQFYLKKANIIIHSDDIDFISELIQAQDDKKISPVVAISTGAAFPVDEKNFMDVLNINKVNRTLDDLIFDLSKNISSSQSILKVIEETSEFNLELLEKLNNPSTDLINIKKELSDVLNSVEVFMKIFNIDKDDLLSYRKSQIIKHLTS
jgi:NTP pyrophosphatase (non-canonical NTP hydrolase)